MYHLIEHRLSRWLNARQASCLVASTMGVEKESLRVSGDGQIAQTPHPAVLGSPLTHPYITTDYSEALLELITPPMDSRQAALAFLCDTHRFVYEQLEDEILWATSMPCVVAGEESIPIAHYGRSNLGMMKTIYRRGLGHRYGRIMQVIAGVHFNFSLDEAFWEAYQDLEQDNRPRQAFRDDHYFRMIRNLQRFGWLVPYLFGASPAVCKSFLGGRTTTLEAFDAGTYFEPYGTSMRMGDIGYQNSQECAAGIKACYDDLDCYVLSLSHAIETSCSRFTRIGVVVDGEYRQLNDKILQIENEYYSTVRPKQPPADNEKPSLALRRRGVQYVELRSLDVNAFDPLGISDTQVAFLEAFMLFCLFHDSPVIGDGEREAIDRNQLLAAHRGRDPQLMLQRGRDPIPLRAWAGELLDAMEGLCEMLDEARGETCHGEALAAQRIKVDDPAQTPSAQMLSEMRANGESFYHFARRMSRQHFDYFRNRPLSAERQALFTRAAEESHAQRRAIEASDDRPFDAFLQDYFAQH